MLESLYLILGGGLGYMDQPLDRPWWWQQPAYEHHQSERTTAYALGMGLPITQSLSAELTYRDFGEYHGFVAFQEREKVADDPATACPDPCDKTQYAYNTGTVRGVSLTGRYSWTYAHVTLGLIAFRSTWNHYRTDVNNDHATYMLHSVSRENRVSGIGGVGLRYRSLSLDFDVAAETQSDEMCCSPWRRSASLMMVYRGMP